MKKRVLIGLFFALFIVLSPSQAADYFTEDFGDYYNQFDMDGLSLTFTPDGSPDFYSAKAVIISTLPVDAAAHLLVPLGDDDYKWVSLSGKTVKLYGVPYSGVSIGSNGYLTFQSSDATYISSITNHFSEPRISMLFSDLNPSTGGSVKWAQLNDRLAVTFTDISPYGLTSYFNTFQVEMFFDGVIRISWLGIDSPYAVVGLSGRYDIPPAFMETNLSAFGWDLDDDGIPNTWETAYFTGFTNCSAGMDSDGDGYSNLEEYITGADPTNRSSFFHITTKQQDSGGSKYIITWDAIEGREYSIRSCENLIFKPFNVLASGINFPVNSYTDTIDQVQSSRIYKVDVKLAE